MPSNFSRRPGNGTSGVCFELYIMNDDVVAMVMVFHVAR